MRSRPLLILGAMAALAASSALPAAAQTSPGPSTIYQLASNSQFITGCFAPCLCPVLYPSRLQGTFVLREIGFDGLYTNYEVSNVQWVLPDLTKPVQVRGSGTYRVGGEVAIQQQLALDLTFDSGAPLHFDSGLVAGGGGFPAIDIRTSLHQERACTDSVFDVKASPAVATSAGDGAGGERVFAVTVVNPFYGATDVRLRLARAERVDIDVFDAQGRLVRHLARQRPVSAGPSTLTWDGLDEHGRSVAAGIYAIRVRTPEGQTVRRAVKLR